MGCACYSGLTTRRQVDLCLLLGFDNEASSGFVQAPQQFYGALKDDPFGNQLVVLQGVGIRFPLFVIRCHLDLN